MEVEIENLNVILGIVSSIIAIFGGLITKVFRDFFFVKNWCSINEHRNCLEKFWNENKKKLYRDTLTCWNDIDITFTKSVQHFEDDDYNFSKVLEEDRKESRRFFTEDYTSIYLSQTAWNFRWYLKRQIKQNQRQANLLILEMVKNSKANLRKVKED